MRRQAEGWYDVNMDFIRYFLVTAVIFVVIDAVWLTLVAKKFYQDQLGSLLRPKAMLPPAVVFYLLYVIGIVIFALQPALAVAEWSEAAWRGGLLGLLMYATYDLTNYSTLKNWPARVVYVDMAWGTFVTALTTTFAYAILR